jgi:hypothetical protein
VEQLLTEAGVDYVVEAEEYSAGTLFPRMRVGAFFYVSPASDMPSAVSQSATSAGCKTFVERRRVRSCIGSKAGECGEYPAA